MGIFWTQKEFFAAITDGDAHTVSAYLAKNKSWAYSKDKKTEDLAIHLAAKSGHALIVSLLLKAGAQAVVHGGNSRLPLHLAAEGGNADTVKVLLEAGASGYINAVDAHGLSPLQYAIQNGRTEVLKTFLDTRKTDLTAGDRPALYFAVESNRADCVEILLAAGADPNVPRSYTQYDYDDDYDGYYRSRHSSGKNTVLHYSALNCACLAGRDDIAVMLLKAGAKVLPGEFPIHAAATAGNIPLVTDLIRYGLDVKQLNGAKQTALHAALAQITGAMSADMVEFLLAQGLDRNALDAQNRTALSYAQQYAQTDIVRILTGETPAPVLRPVAPLPPKPAIVIPPVSAPAPAAVPAVTVTPLVDDDAWTLSGKSGVVHATIFPGLSRRLTEIFNFDARERITITENLALRTETMSPHESFDTINDEALKRAYAEFRRLGGKADEEKVFGNRLMKLKLKP